MMFWNFGPRVDKVNELLDKEGVTLTEILEQDSFSSSVRNSSNQRLFDFLNRQDNMKELLKWALSDEYKDKPKYAKLANAAVIAFSSSKPFQQVFMANQIFLDRFTEFAKSEPPSSRSCGHYQRIIESLANGTKGEILTQLIDFPNFLINNITDMALKDLFVLMATEYAEKFGFNTDLLIKLVSTTNNDNGLFIVSAIREIIKNNNELKSKVFDSEDFIDLLFKISIEKAKDQPLLATELFRLLETFKEFQNFNSVLAKYSQNYEYQYNISLPFQVRVFEILNPKLLDLFFDPSSCSLLVEAIYFAFSKKSKEEQIELSKSCNLKQKAIEAFPKSITNARISYLARQIFEDIKDLPESENDQTFAQFVQNEAEERIKILDSKYGGRVMNDDYEDEEEDEVDIESLKNKAFGGQDSDSDSLDDSDSDDSDDDDDNHNEQRDVSDEEESEEVDDSHSDDDNDKVKIVESEKVVEEEIQQQEPSQQNNNNDNDESNNNNENPN